jgi:hypothetical protein
MAELRQRGLGLDTVAEALNAEDMTPRAVARWYATSVYRVLKAAAL